MPTPRTPGLGDRVPLSTLEELHIRRVLAEAGSLQEAADILGIDQATLVAQAKGLRYLKHSRHSWTLLFARLTNPSPFKFQAPTFE